MLGAVRLQSNGMIFSKELVFLHVPKTGGMSTTRYLLQVLPRPIYYSVVRPDARASDAGIHQFSGIRHETLAEARDIVREYGFNILDFPLILAGVRNPYAIELSRYKYMQQGYSWLSGSAQELAMNEDFAAFADKSPFHAGSSRPLESYFLLDGEAPPNLQILRAENLAEDLQVALRRIGIDRAAELPHENESFHGDYRLYYTREAEETVYLKYKWAFEAGLYERFDPGPVTEVEALKHELRDLKFELSAQKRETRRIAEAYPLLERWAHELEGRLIDREGRFRRTRPWIELTGSFRRLRQWLTFRGGRSEERETHLAK